MPMKPASASERQPSWPRRSRRGCRVRIPQSNCRLHHSLRAANLHHLSERLRMNGWLVPAYTLPEGLADITVQRIVVRNGFTRDLAASFLADLKKEVAYLDALAAPMPDGKQKEAFHH